MSGPQHHRTSLPRKPRGFNPHGSLDCTSGSGQVSEPGIDQWWWYGWAVILGYKKKQNLHNEQYWKILYFFAYIKDIWYLKTFNYTYLSLCSLVSSICLRNKLNLLITVEVKRLLNLIVNFSFNQSFVN